MHIYIYILVPSPDRIDEAAAPGGKPRVRFLELDGQGDPAMHRLVQVEGPIRGQDDHASNWGARPCWSGVDECCHKV